MRLAAGGELLVKVSLGANLGIRVAANRAKAFQVDDDLI
jgi:hypothetical protein